MVPLDGNGSDEMLVKMSFMSQKLLFDAELDRSA